MREGITKKWERIKGTGDKERKEYNEGGREEGRVEGIWEGRRE